MSQYVKRAARAPLAARPTALERYRASLRTAGGCMTVQRRLVLAEVTAMGPHFDVERLVRRMAGRSPAVSRATVYRTVAHLERLGLIRRAVFGEPHAHYESALAGSEHGHLVCRACGRVVEVADRFIEKRLSAVARRHRFRPEGHAVVQVTGLCQECSKRGPAQSS